MRLYCMCGGTLTFDQSVFTHTQGMGMPVEVPTPIALIVHPKGKVLFETTRMLRLMRSATGAPSAALAATNACLSGRVPIRHDGETTPHHPATGLCLGVRG